MQIAKVMPPTRSPFTTYNSGQSCKDHLIQARGAYKIVGSTYKFAQTRTLELPSATKHLDKASSYQLLPGALKWIRHTDYF